MSDKWEIFGRWQSEVGTLLADENFTEDIIYKSPEGGTVMHLKQWMYTPIPYNGELYTIVKKLKYGDLDEYDAPENIIFRLPQHHSAPEIYGLIEERTPEMRKKIGDEYAKWWPQEKARRESRSIRNDVRNSAIKK